MKVHIRKDGHGISDFASEKDALAWFAENEDVEVCYEPIEYVVCAAIWYDNGIEYPFQKHYGIETGFVLGGYRHPHIGDILPTNPNLMLNVFGHATPEETQKYDELRVKYGWHEKDLTRCKAVQGFITSNGRFVNRKEAFDIAKAAGQTDENGGIDGELFSEDLY